MDKQEYWNRAKALFESVAQAAADSITATYPSGRQKDALMRTFGEFSSFLMGEKGDILRATLSGIQYGFGSTGGIEGQAARVIYALAHSVEDRVFLSRPDRAASLLREAEELSKKS